MSSWFSSTSRRSPSPTFEPAAKGIAEEGVEVMQTVEAPSLPQGGPVSDDVLRLPIIGSVTELPCPKCNVDTKHMLVADKVTVSYVCLKCDERFQVCTTSLYRQVVGSMHKTLRTMVYRSLAQATPQ